jgi:uncharacterized protein (DUF58 family)
MTGRLLFLSFMVYGLLFVGLVTLNGAIILLTIPLLLFIGSALLYPPPDANLFITRTFSAKDISQGLPVEIKLDITNQGQEIDDVFIEEVLPAEVELLSGKTTTVTALSKGSSISLVYTVLAKRGRHIFHEVNFNCTDSMGLIHKKTSLYKADFLMILPKAQKLRSVPIRPRRTHGFSGPVPSRKVGAGVNFMGLREYQIGDPLRWINWRVSARHTEDLFTNEFEQDRIADVGLILDARMQSDVAGAGGDDGLFEHSIRATVALADSFLTDGNRVGLLIYGRGMEFVLPGYGKVQRQRILQALASAHTGSSFAFKSLEYLPTRFYPSHSQIVLVSPLEQDDLPVLTQLRALGYELLVISPDAIAFEASHLNHEKSTELAVRIARIERQLLIKELKRIGIPVVDWQVDQSLDKALDRVVSPHVLMQHFLRI